MQPVAAGGAGAVDETGGPFAAEVAVAGLAGWDLGGAVAGGGFRRGEALLALRLGAVDVIRHGGGSGKIRGGTTGLRCRP